MSKRRCAATNCPKLTPAGRTYCDTHAKQHDRARGKTTARGYGWTYQQQRAKAAALVNAGRATCWRCGQPITPGTPWDLGHDDHDRTTLHGPEHATCNRSAGGRAAHPQGVTPSEAAPDRR